MGRGGERIELWVREVPAHWWVGGAELVEPGLADLAARRETVEALLVAIGEPRLRRLGLAVPAHAYREPEHQLYHLLASRHGDAAHSRYNALIRRLVSFERAAGGSGQVASTTGSLY
ncbi:MAG: hypothetical protein U0002_08515 [Thermoanaerobaculia bacterium]